MIEPNKDLSYYGDIKMSDNLRVIQSAKLGKVEFHDEDILTLVTPLLGFSDLSDFLLINNSDYYPFLWFQSVEDPSVCFIVIEPCPFFPNYKPIFGKREFKVMGVKDSSGLKIFCIVVIPDTPTEATANLRAPLIINFERKIAKQSVLDDDDLQIREPLFPDKK
jgi:flagellar assembly factor FliW